MPYIEKNRRRIFDERLEGIMYSCHVEKGDLTYCIYKLGLEYMKSHKKNYQNISDAVAAMNDSAAEFRRRHLNLYEDTKIKLNGDIKWKHI